MNWKNPFNAIVLTALLIVVAAGVVVFASNDSSDDSDASNTAQLEVATSFYVIEHFAERVGGDLVNVINVVPAGVDAHDFEPTPKDVAQIQDADVFMFHGAGLDSWAEDLAAQFDASRVVEMTESFELREITEDAHDEDEELEEHEEEHGHGDVDPHIWLDPALAAEMVDVIQDALITKDPSNTSLYRSNADAYKQELAQLHEEFVSGLFACELNTIVVSHDAFGYLGTQYGLEIESIAGISPEEEPSTRQLAEIVETAESNNVEYIFFETLASPKLAETVAAEIGGGTLVLNPIEGLTPDEQSNGATYTSVMRENLANLQTALRCGQ